MAVKAHNLLASVLALSVGVMGALAQEAKKPEKKVKDQAEYDLLQLVNKEAAGPKKIELLDQWKQKYPDSEFKEDRAFVYVQTYQTMNNAQKMWEACEDLYAINPKNGAGLFYLMSLAPGDPSRFAKGEKYINEFISEIPNIIAADKPADRKAQEATARKALGQIAVAQKNFLKAEQIYSDFLKWNPNSGNISYALGNAILMQKDKAKQIPALWHLARAAYYTGEDALPDVSKKQLQAFFEKTYVNYHGSKDGLQEVIDSALKSPFPPEGWKITSQAEELEKKMQKIKEEDPQLYLWLQIKENLSGATATDYWGQLKGSAMPKFKGKVVSSNPPIKTKEVIVGISGPDLSEVKLILEQPVGKIEPGTEIEFEGAVPTEFAADPFMVTADIENAKVTGLPKAVGPAGRVIPKKAAGKKR